MEKRIFQFRPVSVLFHRHSDHTGSVWDDDRVSRQQQPCGISARDGRIQLSHGAEGPEPVPGSVSGKR